MNKDELVAMVADRAGCTKADAEIAVYALFNAIEEGLVKAEKDHIIRGIGYGRIE